ncbi:MAG: 30S ribosomal protein S20 [Clostridia bacterium]|nr:30S ribosomal protein S20 [Clostridia bacterium]
MPNIKSAKKRVKVIEAKTLQNKMLKSALKTSLKNYEKAVADGDAEKAQALYKDAVKTIDQAVAHGIIHKNNAARKKSRFTLMLNKVNA